MLVQGWSGGHGWHGRRSWSGLRSRPCGESWHEHLGGRCLVAEGCMRPDGIVMTAPALDDDLRLAESVEDLAVEQLVPEPGIKALDIAILPRAAWSDVGGLGSDRRDPLLDGLGNELRAVVGADVARHAAQDEQVREHVDDVDGLELASDADRQALVRELVDDVEHPEPPSVVRPVLDEVVGPDVVAMLGPQPDARSVRQPEPSAFGLLPGHLQPLASPNSLYPLVVDEPACSEQLGDLAVAVASVLPSRLDAQILPAPGERARCRPGDARGLEVSPGCLLQDQLVQRQVGNRSAQPRVLSLESLQSLDLIALEPAKLLAPAVVRDLRNPNRAYRLGNALPLRHQHIHLAQLRNDLLGLVSLPRHRGPPWLESHTSGRTTSKGEDHLVRKYAESHSV